MGEIIERSQIVLTRGDEGTYKDCADEEFHGVMFGSEGAFSKPGDRSANDHMTLVIPNLTWCEMGGPDEITVTLEPGDKLHA